MNLHKTDKKFLLRDEPADECEVVKSDGSFIFGPRGKKYIDFYMGWCVGNMGWGNEAIKKKLRRFQGPDYVNPSFLYRPWAELAELLAKITPGKLKKCFRATGGTEAVELALLTANAYTKKSKFISIEGSFHGNSIANMSIGSSSFKEHHPGLLFRSYKVSPPLDNRAADKVEKFLKKGNVAALIMEPIICNLGVLIPSQEFMTRIQKLCKQYHALLIMDEVATGFGRTGKLFASEHFGIEPDIMCLAKAITGGYGAMGATIATEEVAKAMEFPSSYYSTYGWYPLSVEAALTNIKYILKHKNQLLKNVETMSQFFYEKLSAIGFKYPAEIRAKGLAIGVEFEHEDYGNQIATKALKKGLLLSPDDQSFCLFPALNIDKKTAQQGLDILRKCVI